MNDNNESNAPPLILSKSFHNGEIFYSVIDRSATSPKLCTKRATDFPGEEMSFINFWRKEGIVNASNKTRPLLNKMNQAEKDNIQSPFVQDNPKVAKEDVKTLGKPKEKLFVSSTIQKQPLQETTNGPSKKNTAPAIMLPSTSLFISNAIKFSGISHNTNDGKVKAPIPSPNAMTHAQKPFAQPSQFTINIPSNAAKPVYPVNSNHEVTAPSSYPKISVINDQIHNHDLTKILIGQHKFDILEDLEQDQFFAELYEEINKPEKKTNLDYERISAIDESLAVTVKTVPDSKENGYPEIVIISDNVLNSGFNGYLAEMINHSRVAFNT